MDPVPICVLGSVWLSLCQEEALRYLSEIFPSSREKGNPGIEFRRIPVLEDESGVLPSSRLYPSYTVGRLSLSRPTCLSVWIVVTKSETLGTPVDVGINNSI